MKYNLTEAVVCVVGVGYVGFPLAEAFSKRTKVIGFDISVERVMRLNQDYGNGNLLFTDDPNEIKNADFIIITVPTPVTKSKEPDLSHIESAASIVSQNIKKGSVVVLESTVYPGVTEEIVKPILEESGLKCGKDFKLAYSPERINPGDKEHAIERITKVVAGIDEETTNLIAELYSMITPHIFKARDIRTAEAAKVIENIQRDLNISLMNELAMIFEKMGLSTKDILDTAATKWNFHRYSPGLVGGHCIPVDPYYLVHKARELGYHPQVITAGRAINDNMPKYLSEVTIKSLNQAGKLIKGSRVLIMGFTYKEDVNDIRETPMKKLIKELSEYGVEVLGFDPLLSKDENTNEFGIRLLHNLENEKEEKFDCIILAVAHSLFRRFSLGDLKKIQNNAPILIDVYGVFSADEAHKAGFLYKTL